VGVLIASIRAMVGSLIAWVTARLATDTTHRRLPPASAPDRELPRLLDHARDGGHTIVTKNSDETARSSCPTTGSDQHYQNSSTKKRLPSTATCTARYPFTYTVVT
jgi:hypothetical protein